MCIYVHVYIYIYIYIYVYTGGPAEGPLVQAGRRGLGDRHVLEIPILLLAVIMSSYK